MSTSKVLTSVASLERALGQCFAACEHYRRGASAVDAACADRLLAAARAVLGTYGEVCADEAEFACLHGPMADLAAAIDRIDERRQPTLPGIDAPCADRPWHPLEIDRTAECVRIEGVPVPEGALLELRSDGGPVLVRLCEVTRATAWGRIDLCAVGVAHDRIPVAVRLYVGALARLAHAAEGRRD